MARIVFMGTPEFAVPSLRTLVREHEVAGVITQPDRRAGRGRKLSAAPTRTAAHELGLPVITPADLRDVDALSQITDWKPDLIVVAAYGHILRPGLLELPASGCINVHASLLPRHRGAAPVAAAILAGDARTGVTIMKMDAGLDTGPVLAQGEIAIDAGHTTGALTAELAALGAQLLRETLPAYLRGKVKPQPQDDALVSYAPMLKKADGRLRFSRRAVELERQVRAMQPWPGAFALRGGQPLKLLHAQVAAGEAPPGRVLLVSGGIAVGTGAGLLRLKRIQPPGKRAMATKEYARGAPDFVGDTLE